MRDCPDRRCVSSDRGRTMSRHTVTRSGTMMSKSLKRNQKWTTVSVKSEYIRIFYQRRKCQYKVREDFAPKANVKQYWVSKWSENRATAKSNGSDEPEIFSIRAGAGNRIKKFNIIENLNIEDGPRLSHILEYIDGQCRFWMGIISYVCINPLV